MEEGDENSLKKEFGGFAYEWSERSERNTDSEQDLPARAEHKGKSL